MKNLDLNPMKKNIVLLSVAGLLSVTAQAQLIDDFSGDLSPYEPVRILDANGGPHNNYQWMIVDETLVINTATYDGIEQSALYRTDYSLDVGSQLVIDYLNVYLDAQDIGLFVGKVPVVDVRSDYVDVYVRNNGQVFSRGFDGTTELSLAGGMTPANIDALFIGRPTSDTFDLGYYDGATRNVITTRTISNGNAAGIGTAIGFYADVRAQGTRGSLDNLWLTPIPEPSTAAVLGMGLAGIMAWKRRKRC